MSLLISNTRFPREMTSTGRVAKLVIGDSIYAGSAPTYGATPTAGTVYQVNLLTRVVTEIGATDMSDSVGYTVGSLWPRYGIHYNAATGKKPMILNHAISGSTFEEWVTIYLDTVIPNAQLFLIEQELDKFESIHVSLGINDRDDPDLAGVQVFCNTFYDRLLAAFPGTRIHIAQAALSSPTNSGIMTIKKMIKQKIRDENMCRFGLNFQTIHSAGYFYDANHANTAGNDEMGKMVARSDIHAQHYTKEAAAMICSRFDDADLTTRSKIQAFTNSLGDYIYDIDFLSIGKQPASYAVNQLIDFAFLHGQSNFSSFFTADYAAYSINASSYIRTGINPSLTLMKATVSDMLMVIDYLADSGTADSDAALFGGVNGTSAFVLKQVTANTEIRGRANTLSTDEVLETTANFTIEHRYGLSIEGTTLQITQDGTSYGSPLTVVGAQVLTNEYIAPGGIISGGTLGSMRPLAYRFHMMGKSTTANKSTLDTALVTLVT